MRRLFVLDGDGLFRTDHHGLACLIKVFLADQTVTDHVPITAFVMNRKPCVRSRAMGASARRKVVLAVTAVTVQDA